MSFFLFVCLAFCFLHLFRYFYGALACSYIRRPSYFLICFCHSSDVDPLPFYYCWHNKVKPKQNNFDKTIYVKWLATSAILLLFSKGTSVTGREWCDHHTIAQHFILSVLFNMRATFALNMEQTFGQYDTFVFVICWLVCYIGDIQVKFHPMRKTFERQNIKNKKTTRKTLVNDRARPTIF